LSPRIDAFFSCSFRDDDKAVNSIFEALARGIGIQLTNVDTAATATPPGVAKRKIEASQLLIAVCVRRDQLSAGKFTMPQAVHDEISIAYGLGVPVIMFVEGGVQFEGFKTNYGTYHSFDREKLAEPAVLESVVRAIFEAKMDVLGPEIIGSEHGMAGCHADYVRHLVELHKINGSWAWSYSTAKKLSFTETWKGSFPSGVWPTVECSHLDQVPAQWSSELIGSSRDIKLLETIEKSTPDCIEVQLKPEPHPENGDFIEYKTSARSSNINAIWLDQTTNCPNIHLEKGDFTCADGLIFIHRTKKAKIEFRFPAEYGLKLNDIVPFVGSYTSKVDYEVPSESERATISVDDFGGNIVIRMDLTSPLPGHIYGIAWNPPLRPTQSAEDGSAGVALS
jgi:hypothetical protein